MKFQVVTAVHQPNVSAPIEGQRATLVAGRALKDAPGALQLPTCIFQVVHRATSSNIY